MKPAWTPRGMLASSRTLAASVLLATALLCCVPLVGCASEGANAPSVSAMRHPTLEDFPIPSGFSLVDNRSRSYAPGAMRIVQYEFSGSAPRGSVQRFFDERLPAEGWTRCGQRYDEGIYMMRFENEKEECDLRIRKAGMKTVINVDIGPLPRGSADRQPAARKPSPGGS